MKADGDKAQRQAKPGNRYEMWNMYIAGEVGGMAESLARLSEMVDSNDEKVAAAAEAGAKLIVIGRAGEEVGAGLSEIVTLLQEEFSHVTS